MEPIVERWLGQRSSIEGLAERAAANGWFPVLYRYAQMEGLPLPDWASGAWRQNAIRVAINRAEMGRLAEGFDDLGVPFVVLKGEALGRRIFAEPHLRSTFDIDVLVRPKDRPAVWQHLKERGYEQKTEYKPWASNQVAFVHADRSTYVEVHWDIAKPHLPVPDVDGLIERRIEFDCEGTQVPVLPAWLSFVELCYHFQQHKGFFKGLVDVAAFMGAYVDELDWGNVERFARHHGILDLVRWPLCTLKLMADGQLGYEVPVAETLKSKALARWSRARILKRYDPSREPTEFDGRPPFRARLKSVATQSLAVVAADRLSDKIRGAVRPWLMGPHILGQTLGRPLYGELDERLRMDR